MLVKIVGDDSWALHAMFHRASPNADILRPFRALLALKAFVVHIFRFFSKAASMIWRNSSGVGSKMVTSFGGSGTPSEVVTECCSTNGGRWETAA